MERRITVGTRQQHSRVVPCANEDDVVFFLGHFALIGSFDQSLQWQRHEECGMQENKEKHNGKISIYLLHEETIRKRGMSCMRNDEPWLRANNTKEVLPP